MSLFPVKYPQKISFKVKYLHELIPGYILNSYYVYKYAFTI